MKKFIKEQTPRQIRFMQNEKGKRLLTQLGYSYMKKHVYPEKFKQHTEADMENWIKSWADECARWHNEDRNYHAGQLRNACVKFCLNQLAEFPFPSITVNDVTTITKLALPDEQMVKLIMTRQVLMCSVFGY